MSEPFYAKTTQNFALGAISLLQIPRKNTCTRHSSPDGVIVPCRPDCGSTRTDFFFLAHSHPCVVSWASSSPASSLPFSAPCRSVTQHVSDVRPRATRPGSGLRVYATTRSDVARRSATHPRSLLPSSSSSRSEGGLVRGGHERVDTFRARMEAEGGEEENGGRTPGLPRRSASKRDLP